ncbi:MAG: ABC transporter ATP-binding protein [Clostridia bacterium]|nr:ABC transporter ATP-binding protein [Clostridia bacterium]
MNVIEVNRLQKRYGDFALTDLNFTLPEGEIIGLVGENGAGKSTFFRLLMGATRADAGEIRVLGTDVADPAFVEVRQRIGVVPDEPSFPVSFDCRRIGTMLSRIYHGWEEDTFEGYLRRFDLPPDKPFHQLSRGMRMKLSIAVALSHGASLLLLDEPTGGLDVVIRDEILSVFFDFTRQSDHSILITSHIVTDLERLCDRIAFLRAGRLLFCEEKDALLERYALWPTTTEQLGCLPQQAIVYADHGPYGVKALVLREALPPEAESERATLEEIIVCLSKGGVMR